MLVSLRDYSVQIPTIYASSVTDMWGIGNYTLTQGYIRGQLILPVMYHSALSLIMQKIKPFTVTAIFDDKSSIKMALALSYTTLSYHKIDSTALKDGKCYDHNDSTNLYKNVYGNVDIINPNGEATYVYTEIKVCEQYTITSSDGYTWQG